jgi:hypothetical protein
MDGSPVRRYPRIVSNTKYEAWAFLGIVAAAALFAACDGGTTNETSASTSGGTGGSATSTSGSGGATSGTGGEASSSGSGGGASSSSSNSSSSSSGGTGAVVPNLVSSNLYINCQPIVAEDPVIGSFTAEYENQGVAPQSATVLGASLLFSKNGKMLAWSFDVSPPAGGPVQPSKTLSVEHTKQMKTGMVEGFPCEFCGGTWQLSATWDVGGGTMVNDALPEEPVSCVF